MSLSDRAIWAVDSGPPAANCGAGANCPFGNKPADAHVATAKQTI